MKGRELVLSATALALLACPLRAQQPDRLPVVGVLIGLSSEGPVGQARLAGLRAGLEEHGYEVGRNLAIEPRWLERRSVEGLAAVARELVQLQPDVIVTHGEANIRALRQETSEIPIVVAITGDLVGVGHAESLARPGGNVTGLVDISPELSAKRLQLLSELLPDAERIGILWNEANLVKVLDFEVTKEAALALGRQVVSLPIGNADDLAPTFATARQKGADALVVLQDALTLRLAKPIIASAASDRLPTITWLEFAQFGSLLSYGVDVTDAFRQSASFVARILQGASPADLPIEQPTKLSLSVNLETAEALGVTISPAILLRAEEVIE